MKSESLGLHPELLLGDNPLIEGLAPYIPISELPRALLNEPLKGVPWKKISPERRIPLLQQLEDHFFPTPQVIDIADAIQSAMRASLARRNPLSQKEQRRINQLALLQADGNPSLAQLQPLACTASGGIVAAETGVGKTTLIKRALEIFAPDQVIVHGASEACGWSRFAQVNYLHVGLPSNSSRGGLLSTTLGALDALLGTDYMASLRRCKNLDQAMVLVLKLLSIHRVALLVLDEGQPDNLDECEWQRHFVLFFLAMMNLGVPILLCGHPNAFLTLRRSGQVARRFSSIGIFDLDRARDEGADWWSTSLAKGIMRFSLCDKTEGQAELLKMSREVSAGVPGFFALLWREAQRIALSRGGTVATISPTDLSTATTSLGLQEVREMVNWLEGKSDNGRGYSDMTSTSGRIGNGSTDSRSGASETANTRSASESKAATKALDKLRQKEARVSKRKADKAAKEKALIEGLSLADLRHSTNILDIMAGLEEFQGDLFASSKG